MKNFLLILLGFGAGLASYYAWQTYFGPWLRKLRRKGRTGYRITLTLTDTYYRDMEIAGECLHMTGKKVILFIIGLFMRMVSVMETGDRIAVISPTDEIIERYDIPLYRPVPSRSPRLFLVPKSKSDKSA